MRKKNLSIFENLDENFNFSLYSKNKNILVWKVFILTNDYALASVTFCQNLNSILNWHVKCRKWFFEKRKD